MERVDLSVSSESVQRANVEVLAESSDDLSKPAEQTPATTQNRCAAELLALAERSVRWEDDVTAAELQLFQTLYLDVLRQARLELHSSTDAGPPPPELGKGSIASDRTALLQLRAEACALVRHVQQRRRGTRPRPPTPKRWRQFALAAGSFALSGLFTSRDSLAETFDWGNVSDGKPWVASSSYRKDVPSSGVLGDFSEPFFFHTNYEDNPWIEVDLGAEAPARSITIINRKDCCASRAAPLVVETSNDHRAWRIAASQRRNFSHWRARLDTPPARWLRVRVLRQSNLHLKRLTVRK
jgi:hypothetical protein